MTTERDIEMATAHLLASGQTHTKAELDTLAERLGRARREGHAEALMAILDARTVTDSIDEAVDLVLERLRTWEGTAPHAGECALCRAPWVRAADGSARPSCDCVKV